MHVNTQIRRGVERCLASEEAARLSGMYGLAGLSGVDNFNQLEVNLDEAGFSGSRDHVNLLRRRSRVMSDRMIRAVPITRRAMYLMERDGGVAGVFSKIGKALQKVGKAAVKLSPSHYLIKKIKPLRNISPAFRVAENRTPLIQAALGPPKPTDPAVIAQMKADADAAAALARAGVTPGASTVSAGAAVLADQSGVMSPQAAQLAQQVASNLAQPGSTAPTASSFEPAAADEPTPESALPFGLSMPVLVGGAAVLGLLGYMALKKRR